VPGKALRGETRALRAARQPWAGGRVRPPTAKTWPAGLPKANTAHGCLAAQDVGVAPGRAFRDAPG